jgi:CubicO group peptidase (beta-lactamase class C family)
MRSAVKNPVKASALISLGLAMALMGIYAASSEPPGGAVLGFLLMAAAVIFGVRTARSLFPTWVGFTVVAVGALMAAFAAFLIHSGTIEAPLFAQTPGVPSVSTSAPSPQWAAAVDLARPLVRAAIVEQNLPGVSIAVGVGRGVVWAEGFGWRDVVTETPVTPETRFNIGTAAQVITPAAVAPLGLTNTGTDSAAEWSPDHVGEPEEDFPGFTAIHDLILRPLGLSAPRQPLPGNRATFYVPSTFWKGFTADPRAGRRLMYMRDLACCADGLAFYSTPSDLVRFALATNTNIHGELAGGRVMSLTTDRDKGIAIAVASNIAYADTNALAQDVANVFVSPQ